MWDFFATIPLHKEMLQKELENIEAKDQLPREENATRLVQPIKGGEKSRKIRHPPFYVS